MRDLVTASYQHSYREEMSNALGIAGPTLGKTCPGAVAGKIGAGGSDSD